MQVQMAAWEAIRRGQNTLVVAPTGSGKTLAAFMWAIDQIAAQKAAQKGTQKAAQKAAQESTGDSKPGVKVLYISPLKALGVDVERNLQAPLIGIAEAARALGVDAPKVSVGVRSGDTSQRERRRLVTNPPDILITTPESLYLMLTSDAARTLETVTWVIIDEIHALAPTKRGAHLALSLERLEMLTGHPIQRIGLSATARPLKEVARFLGGGRPVEVIAPPAKKRFDITVEVPVEDMTNPPLSEVDVKDASSPLTEHRVGSMWPSIEASLYQRIVNAHSTIVFTNSRRQAERLTARLNQIHAEALAEARADTRADTRAGTPADTRAATLADTLGEGLAAPEGATAELNFARAHHGSIAKEARKSVEEQLKTGDLACVVATSSLELGIDMGSVDQVIQIDPPPSVISGLQRLGRSGHEVGGVSRAIFYPTHRSKLIPTAAIVKGMLTSELETLKVVSNPLDVLAQQTIAAASAEPINVDAWFDVIRRSAPYTNLPRSAFNAVLDLVSGKYPSSEFANLRARVDWDRHTNTLTARPGAKRLAVTQGGTIPDRGLYRVVLAAGDDTKEQFSPRIGELDEEMVYETRVGEVFTLGTTSWRVREIGRDKVEVVPAFGVPGKTPFWRGDSAARPASLGRVIGEMTGALAADVENGRGVASAELRDLGFDENAVNNTLAYVAEQLDECGAVPTARNLLVEQTRDEVGDWRLILESPYGMEVHGPWALAVNARIQERYGADGQAVPSNDGIIVRLSDTSEEPPGAELFQFEPQEILDVVTDQVEGSSLFASRFRECAGRALVLGGGKPGTRSPLWQQRQRSARLLEVASRYRDFPIILETLRECLQDVYDTDALASLMKDIAARRVRLSQVLTPNPGPFARSLLFGYVGEFVYQGDTPLGERRIAALSVDPKVLRELLGDVELRELLEPAAVEQVGAELQRTAPSRRVVGKDGLVDLLRALGPLSRQEISARTQEDAGPLIEAALKDRRAFNVRIAGHEMVAAVEDAGLLAGALGVVIPAGVADVFRTVPPDPVRDLLYRYAQTNIPFTVAQVVGRFGMSSEGATVALAKLESEGIVVRGHFLPDASQADGSLAGASQTAGGPDGPVQEFVAQRVLDRLRAVSLALLRGSVEPVDPLTYARFLQRWQYLGDQLRGLDGVMTAIDLLTGLPLPASTLETLIIPTRVANYQPGMLDDLCVSGEVTWIGQGSLSKRDGWVTLHPTQTLADTVGPRPKTYQGTALQVAIWETLVEKGALFIGGLTAELAERDLYPSASVLSEAIWDLVWAGVSTSDSFAALRAKVAGSSGAQKTAPRRGRPHSLRGARGLTARSLAARGLGGEALSSRSHSVTLGDASLAGRWSLVEPVIRVTEEVADQPAPELSSAQATSWLALMLERYGVVTSGAVKAEEFPGGFAQAYRLLTDFENAGLCRRGYYVTGQGGAQFAASSTVDELRSIALEDGLGSEGVPLEHSLVTLSAVDPANPYGSSLSWPELDGEARHLPRRNPGALITLAAGSPVLYLERGGRSMLTFTWQDGEDLAPASRTEREVEELRVAAAKSLAQACRRGQLASFTVETVDGLPVGLSQWSSALQQAGFEAVPKGLRLRRKVI